jgi:hypothetical protein
VKVVFYGTPGAPPVVRADSFTVAEGGTLTLPPSQGLLVNDDVLRGSTINVAGSHVGVALTVQPDGGFTFVAPSGITATSVYVYSYTVTDAFGQTSAPTTISVQVDDRPSPVGQSDAYVVFEGETLNVSALLGLLANDAPVPGTHVATYGASNVGTVTVNPDGAFTFVVPVAVTEDTYATFDYVLVDAQGQRSAPIPVTILVANRQLFADVSIEVLPSQPVYDFGTTQQSVTVRVRNDGPSAIDELHVAFGYENFSVVSATTASGTSAFDTGAGSWTVGPLVAGATADLVITSGTAAGGVTPRLTAEITQVRRSGEIVLDPDSTAGNGTGLGEDDEATGTWSVSGPPTIVWYRTDNFMLERMPDGTDGRFVIGFSRNGDLTRASTLFWTVEAAVPPSIFGNRSAQSADVVGGFRSGTLDFAPGQATAEIIVQYVNDTLHEPSEFFALTLTGATNGRIVDQSEWIVEILDDEPNLYSIAGTSDAAEGTAPGAGGELAFVIRREGTLDNRDVTFTVGGSGAAGSGDAADLVDGFGTRTVTFADGETERRLPWRSRPMAFSRVTRPSW